MNPKGLQTEMENKKIRFLSNKKRQKNQEEYDRLNKENLITNRSDFLTLESYRAARTNIMFSLPDEKGCKKMVVTSAMPGDGKTTTSINLALIFAQTGARVLLIDADLRLPMIHHYLDIPNNNGLSNVLAGLADVNDVIVKKSGIDLITAGHIPQNPTELLSSDAMTNLVENLSKDYDYIIIDTPPVGVLIDAVAILKPVSGVILVVRQDYTIIKAINSALTALEFANAKILGFILNHASVAEYSYKKKKYKYNRYRYDYYYDYSSK